MPMSELCALNWRLADGGAARRCVPVEGRYFGGFLLQVFGFF